jgi:putative peptidoglycan lipid II flippase
VPFVIQANLAVERVVASWIDPRSIPALDYARFVCETGMALAAMPLGFAVLGHLGHLGREELHDRLNDMLVPVVLLGGAVSLWLFGAAEEVTVLLFRRGAFDADAVALTSSILSWSVLGLAAHMAGYLLLRGMNLTLRNARYTLSLAIAAAANLIFNLTVWPRFGAQTLGMGYALYCGALLAATLTLSGMWRGFLSRCWLALVALGGFALAYRADVLGARGDLAARTLLLLVAACVPLARASTRAVLRGLLFRAR